MFGIRYLVFVSNLKIASLRLQKLLTRIIVCQHTTREQFVPQNEDSPKSEDTSKMKINSKINRTKKKEKTSTEREDRLKIKRTSRTV